MIARVHLKLERGLLQFIAATKGERLAGLNIVAGHGKLEPVLPYLSVWCGKAKPHPDFDGCGRGYPELVPAGFGICHNAEDATSFEETIGQWADNLDSILAAPAEEGGADYSALLAFLNRPAEGEDPRDFGPLQVAAVFPDGDDDEINDETWDVQAGLEIVATNGEPEA